MDSATLTHAAKLTVIPLSFALAGYGYAASHSSVPVLYDMPAQYATPAFKTIFYSGAYVVPPTSLLCQIAAGYLAYALPQQRTLWSIACAAHLLHVPWTGLVMFPGINRLLAISQDKAKQEKATASLEHRQLLVRWVAQNTIRASFYLVAGLAALRAVGDSL